MINKKLEKLLEEAIAKRQALKESELGSAAAEPVHGSGEAKEHTPELDNKDVYPADEHEQSEEVEEIVVESGSRHKLRKVESLEKKQVPVSSYYKEKLSDFVAGGNAGANVKSALKAGDDETQKKLNAGITPSSFGKEVAGVNDEKTKEYKRNVVKSGNQRLTNNSKTYLSESYTREDLLELFEALELDTDKYTFEYLAEELGFVPEGEVEMEQPEVVEMQPQQDPEYDEEGSMAKSQLITIADAAAELYNMMEDETNLPEWVQSKLTLSKEYIDTVRDYLKSEMIKQSQDMAEMQPQPEMVEVPAEAVEMPVEQSLQEKYVLKRPVGRPSAKSKMLDAKGGTELSEKGEVVYTRNKK
jgi:hypothetical protein